MEAVTAIGLIVEGHGEVQALPILVRRIATRLDPALAVAPVGPNRVPRGKRVQEHELKRALELMARKLGPGAPIRVRLDADDDGPARLGPRLRAWAEDQRRDLARLLDRPVPAPAQEPSAP